MQKKLQKEKYFEKINKAFLHLDIIKTNHLKKL
jgi:hypothetical protein